jgi:hypothetical protein
VAAPNKQADARRLWRIGVEIEKNAASIGHCRTFEPLLASDRQMKKHMAKLPDPLQSSLREVSLSRVDPCGDGRKIGVYVSCAGHAWMMSRKMRANPDEAAFAETDNQGLFLGRSSFTRGV